LTAPGQNYLLIIPHFRITFTLYESDRKRYVIFQLENRQLAGDKRIHIKEGNMAEIKNRRRGPDRMVRMITMFSIASWVMIFVALLVYQVTFGSFGSYGSIRRTLLDFSTGLIMAKVLLFLNFLLCIWGMAMNMMRNKRKSDRFRASLVISALVSLAGFVLMMIVF
jgi:hypothetical protein